LFEIVVGGLLQDAISGPILFLSNTTGVTSRAGIAHHSLAPEFIPVCVGLVFLNLLFFSV
jgi:hypothetical protein